MSKTTTTRYACTAIHAPVRVIRLYELATGIGDDRAEWVLLDEKCSHEHCCPELLRCPLRQE